MADDMGGASGPELRGSPHELSFEQTVPRSLVHRVALAEVYVADSLQSGDEEFVLAIQIPRAHCVWFDRRVAYHDPLSMAEAARQGVYVVVHRHIGLPAGLAMLGLSGSPRVSVDGLSLTQTLVEYAVMIVTSTLGAVVLQWLRFPGGLVFGAMLPSAVAGWIVLTLLA